MNTTRLIQRCAWLGTFVAAVAAPIADAGDAGWTKLMEKSAALRDQGNYEQATAVSKEALALAEASDESDHRDILESLHRLAGLYLAADHYAEAEHLYERILTIHKDSTAANALIDIYIAQGKFVQAEPLVIDELTHRAKIFGPDDVFFATSLYKLAGLYVNEGKFADAEPLYRRALAIRENKRGPNHGSLNNILMSLALLCDRQGRYTEALALYRRAIAIREDKYGANSPEVATALISLALTHEALGEYAQAETLYLRALPIRLKTSGPDHPDVALVLNGLGGAYSAHGKYEQAEVVLKRALEMIEKRQGPDHPSVVTSLNNLGVLYTAQGNSFYAETAYKRALSIAETAHDADTVGLVLYNQAALFEVLGRYAEAEPLYVRSLSIRRKTLGHSHPDVAAMLDAMSRLYGKLGDDVNQRAFEAQAKEIQASLNK